MSSDAHRGPTRKRIVVDAMNVIGSRPDGWWRDRDGAVRRLVARLQRYAGREGRDVMAVVDGRPLPDLAEGERSGVHVVYATRRGPNAADDRIIDIVEAGRDAGAIEVVTSDRALIARARALGATVHTAGWLLRRLDDLDAG